MRVLVCGGRSFNDADLLDEVLMSVYRSSGDLVVIQGGACGADFLAAQWAQARGVPVMSYPAEWHRYGRRAGPVRNQRMLDEGQPDLVLAFPGGRGTADMVARAKKAGTPIRLVGEAGPTA